MPDAPEKPFRVVDVAMRVTVRQWTNVGPLPFVDAAWVEDVAAVIYQLHSPGNTGPTRPGEG